MIPFRERLEGGIFGLLIGDALGVPYEFHAPEALPPLADIEMIPPAQFPRAHARVPPATWSDDGAQALILLASLLDHSALNMQDFSTRLVAWYQTGYMAVDQDVFDVGIQTSQAIQRLIAGTPAHQAGRSDEQANGNGSLMRVLPLALWHRGTDSALVDDAHRQSSVTHGHARAQVCCALYCLWARRILHNSADPWRDAVVALRDIYGRESQEYTELEQAIRPNNPPEGHGSGYVVDSLHSARWALQAGGYEQTVKAAISLGRDTDTTACIAGGIAGVRDGVGAIPKRWHAQLRGTELVEPLVRRLKQWHAFQD
jgi:ADP-ribosyl-[dinitrogen reductase] hydrolase